MEAGDSFCIPQEEDRSGNLDLETMVEACGDLAFKSFVAARYVSRKIAREKEDATSSVDIATLQARGAKLESQLASKNTCNEELATRKNKADEEVVKAQDGLKALGEELNRTLSSCDSMKKNIEALTKDISERNADLEKSKKEFAKYHACHLKGAEGLCDDII